MKNLALIGILSFALLGNSIEISANTNNVEQVQHAQPIA